MSRQKEVRKGKERKGKEKKERKKQRKKERILKPYKLEALISVRNVMAIQKSEGNKMKEKRTA